MIPRKLNILFAFFPYGGNGGISTEHPSIRKWFTRTILTAKADPRVGDICDRDYCDTPITMTRNAAIQDARDLGADVLVMVDSDQHPDLYLGQDPLAKPFWDSSFAALYEHYERGPLCIAAPYCGPPPHENVYIFEWQNQQSEHPNPDFRLQMVGREEAAARSGIQECAAGPTGLIMFDMRCFDLKEPPYCYYEWGDRYERDKASTEDVALTRDIALFGQALLGYSPMRCNWDAWAGHHKPKCVGKPTPLTVDRIGRAYQQAVWNGRRSDERLVDMGTTAISDQSATLLTAPVESREQEVRRRFANGRLADTPAELQLTLGEQVLRETVAVGFSSPACDLDALALLVREESERLGRPLVVVEVGSWVGQSALAMHRALAHGGTIYCVDTWRGSEFDRCGDFAERLGGDVIYQAFVGNVGDALGQGIQPLRGASLAVAENWEGPPIDVVYLDAGHTYGEVARDIEAWRAHVRPGGLLCGHDYDPELFPGVVQAVRELGGDGHHKAVWWKRLAARTHHEPALVAVA